MVSVVSMPLRQRGFTLLEIMLAFVVFSLVFAVSLQVLTGSLRNTTRSEEYTQAALWAQTQFDAIGLEPPLEEGSYSGEFEDGYEWEMDISLYEVPPSEDGSGVIEADVPVELYLVQMVVSWGNSAQPRRARFKTLRSAIPEQSRP